MLQLSTVLRVLAVLKSWSKDVALLTNGPSTVDRNERILLQQNNVNVYDQPIDGFEHADGQLSRVAFKNGTVLFPRTGCEELLG